MALFLALGGGAWALTRNSVGSRELEKNAVKAAEIAKNAVRKAEIGANGVGTGEVANASLLGEDFAPGQLPVGPQGERGPQGPPGPTFAHFADDSDPVASPEYLTTTTSASPTINTPASGRLLAIYSSGGLDESCTTGNGTFGLYVDGVPVPNTRRSFTSAVETEPDTIFGVTGNALPAGSHKIQLGINCTTGDLLGGSIAVGDLGGVLLSD